MEKNLDKSAKKRCLLTFCNQGFCTTREGFQPTTFVVSERKYFAFNWKAFHAIISWSNA